MRIDDPWLWLVQSHAGVLKLKDAFPAPARNKKRPGGNAPTGGTEGEPGALPKTSTVWRRCLQEKPKAAPDVAGVAAQTRQKALKSTAREILENLYNHNM